MFKSFIRYKRWMNVGRILFCTFPLPICLLGVLIGVHFSRKIEKHEAKKEKLDTFDTCKDVEKFINKRGENANL